MSRTVAGRYELTRPIARGGMGEVWAGFDRRLDRAVAVKMLRAETLPAGTDVATLSRRFAREARLTARVEHRGVPAVHDAGTDDGDLFVVMQLIEGRDLADVIAEEAPLSAEWTAAVGAQIAAVLVAAHDVSLVHRDLKPRNVMLSSDGVVTVLDFGVAAILESSVSRLTTTGETLGSPAYMAPEQALEGRAGPSSDLYALGCVIHELLTGSPVFGKGQPLAVMQRHLTEAPPSVAHVSVPLDRLLQSLLAKDPTDRPAGARDVYDALAPLIGGEAGLSTADPTAPFRRPMAPPPARGSQPRRVDVDPRRSVDEVIARAKELVDAGRCTQAVDVLDDALLRATGHDRFRVQLMLATACFFGGDAARALKGYREVEDILAHESGREDMVLRCRSQIASCLLSLGHLDEAVAQFRSVAAEETALRGAGDREVLELREQLAVALASGGDLVAALGELDDLERDAAHALGGDDHFRRRLRELAHRIRERSGRL